MQDRSSFDYINILSWAFIALLLAISCFFPWMTGLTQQVQPSGPVYIVQDGDSLWAIAARFGVAVTDLQSANGITDPNQLRVGDQLTIPGLEGVEGTLVTASIPYGETLRSLSRRYQVPEEFLIRINRLTNPNDLYAGYSFILPEPATLPETSERDSLQPGQSLLELSALHGVNPWSILNTNNLSGASAAVPGDILRVGRSAEDGPGGLPGYIQGVELDSFSILQGKTAEVSISSAADLTLGGSLLEHVLRFYPDQGNSMTALQGVHAMTVPGIYPLEIQGELTDGRKFSFMQMVPVQSIDYPYDQPLSVDPATIDPAVTRPEDAQWSALTESSTPDKYWDGVFKLPSPLDVNYCLQSGDCWSSSYGNRRSYNGSAYLYFHTGLDIVGKTGTDIYAPADGQVVFAGPLTVRGNATMIDHGRGIYSGYMHQSEILVKPGDLIKAGQLIGRVGGTGRVQGPHLHWEIWVGGIQVNPIDWLERSYP